MPTADANTTWLLTKLRGLFRVLADGVALPDAPTLNFIFTGGTVGAAYDSVHNQIDITFPAGAIAADANTFVLRDPHGDVEANEVRADVVTTNVLTVAQGAAITGGLGVFGASPLTSKPVIGGSRGGNAALANLLTQLALMGLITNSTSA